MAEKKSKSKLEPPADYTLKAIMRHSFNYGVGSVIAVPGTSCLPKRISSSRDYTALRSDWNNVGKYINNAVVK